MKNFRVPKRRKPHTDDNVKSDVHTSSLDKSEHVETVMSTSIEGKCPQTLRENSRNDFKNGTSHLSLSPEVEDVASLEHHTGSHDYAEGNFDEDESHASFLKALEEWRGGGGKEDIDVDASDTGNVCSEKTHSVIEIQTEAPVKIIRENSHSNDSRPSSARRSYFFKRLVNTQAAHEAASKVKGDERTVRLKR